MSITPGSPGTQASLNGSVPPPDDPPDGIGLKVVGLDGKPKKAPRYPDDDSSAKLYLLYLETGKLPPKKKIDALDPLWSALFLRVKSEGKAAEESALAWIGKRDPDRAASIRRALAVARVLPSETEEAQKALDGPLSAQPYTDMGNADRLVARYGVNFRHVEKWNGHTSWDGRRWSIGNEAAVMRYAKLTARRLRTHEVHHVNIIAKEAFDRWIKQSESYARLKAMIATANSDPKVSIEAEPMTVFDRHPFLFNTLNCTVDLRTGDSYGHRREDMLTQLAPVEYQPDTECPLWLDTMNLVFGGNKDLIQFWQMVCGFVLTGSVAEQYLPILWGDGENGKSTVLNVLLGLMGSDYATKAPQNFLMVKRQEQHPTELADLYGKRLVVAIETGEGARINETLIKELTGGDIIKARRLYEDGWRFNPTHKTMLGTNHDPVVRGTDHAIWRRLLKVPFTVKITGAKRDKRMPEKLVAEYPGILAWCMRGCLAWQEAGELTIPKQVSTATDAYRNEQDQIGQFIADRCEFREDQCNPEKSDLKYRASAVYAAYKSWMEHRGETALSQTMFGKRITAKGIGKKDSNGIWYCGIKLRDEVTGDRSSY